MPHIVDIVTRPKRELVVYTQETTQTEHRSRRRSRAWHWHLCETRWVCLPSTLFLNIWRSNKPLSSTSMLTNNREKLESSESRWVLYGWEDASHCGEDHTAATSCFTCWTLFTHKKEEEKTTKNVLILNEKKSRSVITTFFISFCCRLRRVLFLTWNI